jgi:cob(I)alamin adenosyltransferase
VGADLATPRSGDQHVSVPRVTEEDVTCLEAAIDRLDSALSPLKQFILPGGSKGGALLHMSRSICRRAERRLVALYEIDSTIGTLPLRYLNRLSDLLFVLARSANAVAGIEEHPWSGRAQ